MQFRGFLLTFLSIISGALILYFILSRGWYPVAIINGKFLSEQVLQKESDAALQYHLATSGEKRPLPENFSQELRKNILDSLIEHRLIYGSLKSQLGNSFGERVSQKLTNLKIDRNKTEEAASLLYGLTFEEFENIVLIPQAAKEILGEQVTSNQENVQDWIKKSRANASVIILDLDFAWEDGRVMLR